MAGVTINITVATRNKQEQFFLTTENFHDVNCLYVRAGLCIVIRFFLYGCCGFYLYEYKRDWHILKWIDFVVILNEIFFDLISFVFFFNPIVGQTVYRVVIITKRFLTVSVKNTILTTPSESHQEKLVSDFS